MMREGGTSQRPRMRPASQGGVSAWGQAWGPLQARKKEPLRAQLADHSLGGGGGGAAGAMALRVGEDQVPPRSDNDGLSQSRPASRPRWHLQQHRAN